MIDNWRILKLLSLVFLTFYYSALIIHAKKTCKLNKKMYCKLRYTKIE